MATTGATLITALALRLRDSGATAHSRALLTTVLTHCQRVVMMAEKVRKTATTSFTPGAGRTLYRTSEVAADVGRIERILAGDRSLPEIAWRGLVNENRHWYRALGSRPRVWARIGGNLFVLTPAQVLPVPVEVVYTIVPADVVDGATDIDLPDEWVPLLMDLSEGIVLFKARIYAAMDAPLTRVVATTQVHAPQSHTKANP